ncbi:MAG: Gfo/Idh/MocA family protein, partial [Chthoniobacterales bacterium]
RRLEKRGYFRLVGIAEPVADCRNKALAEGRVDSLTPWFSNYEELYQADLGIDLVSIATPIPFHYEMTRDALAKGFSVHLEKPPVPLIQQLSNLLTLDKKESVSVGFQFINSRVIQELKQWLIEGRAGRLHSIRAVGCWPRTDKYYARAEWAGRMLLEERPVFDGPATNALAHLIHNILFLASPEPEHFAMPQYLIGELYRARRLESYDCACMRGGFADGTDFAVGVAHCSRDEKAFQILVEGEHGHALVSENGERLETSDGLKIHQPESTEALILKCYDRLAQTHLSGKMRTATRLADTLPYVRTTNALFLSSGGIHDLPTEFISQFGEKDDRGYHLENISEAMEKLMRSGLTFFQTMPWACADPVKIDLASFDYLELSEPNPAAVRPSAVSL